MGGGRLSGRRLALGLAAAAVAGAALTAALSAAPSAGRHALTRSAAATSPATQSAAPAPTSAPTTSPCAAASASTIASVDARAAQGIYTGELHGNEVSEDIAHIKASGALLSALASNDTAAVYAAVHAIVYHPIWHIVRLRVVKAGRVLADVGGPYIIAPVSGPLTFRGRKVGTYVMSVQDDAGFVKLVTRFIGAPVDLYRSGKFVMGTFQPAPTNPGASSSFTRAGRTYAVNLQSALAFPSGNLTVALFAAKPSQALAGTSCASVRLAAWGAVAMHIAARVSPLAAHYRALVDIVDGTSGGLVYVRDGSKRIAGGPGPATLPTHGSVSYAGRSWAVFSWEPVPPARIYFLTPPS